MAELPDPLYDLHSHVLPDIDDGAVDRDMTVAMLRLAAERGVRGIVATPHSVTVADRGGLPLFNDRLGQARALVDEHSIPIRVLPGMEVHLMPDAPGRLAAGEYLTLAGTSYVLVEFDYRQWATYTDEVLFAIAMGSFRPLLAHVERIVPIQEQPHRAMQMVERGYYNQITAMSMLGGFGPEARRTAEYLLRRSAVHIVASDTHRPDGNRQPWPIDTEDRLIALVGTDSAHTLIFENPARLLEGKPLRTIEARPRPRRRWWPLRA